MTTRTSNDLSARAKRRFLEALAEPGAAGADSGLGDGAVVVFAPKGGVTLPGAKAPARLAESLVAEGLAAWSRDGATRRLRATDAGRAHLRRSGAAQAPFLAQHAPLALRVVEKGAPPSLVDDGESPLAWLARRKDRDGRPFLEAQQVEAGERLRRDLDQAQILQRVTAVWEAPIAGRRHGADRGGAVSDIAIDARRRLDRAYDAVGPDLAGLLTDVCGYLKGLETVESERGWPPRSAKVVLRIALERLARHYGLAAGARGPAKSRGVRRWGAEGYRPTLSPAEARD
jgi:hypothetical protein